MGRLIPAIALFIIIMPTLSIIITFISEKRVYWLDRFIRVFKSIVRAIKVVIINLGKRRRILCLVIGKPGL